MRGLKGACSIVRSSGYTREEQGIVEAVIIFPLVTLALRIQQPDVFKRSRHPIPFSTEARVTTCLGLPAPLLQVQRDARTKERRMLTVQGAKRVEIAERFGLPPSMVGHGLRVPNL
jgi:hypothetical protein